MATEQSQCTNDPVPVHDLELTTLTVPVSRMNELLILVFHEIC